jgi:hypothetical protein
MPTGPARLPACPQKPTRKLDYVADSMSRLTFKDAALATFPCHSLFPYWSRIEIANLSLLSAKRLPSGGELSASLYLPLSRPIFSGEYVVNPSPYLSYKRWNSPSTFFLSNILYMGCSTTGAIRPSCLAMPQASPISSADHSEVPQ